MALKSPLSDRTAGFFAGEHRKDPSLREFIRYKSGRMATAIPKEWQQKLQQRPNENHSETPSVFRLRRNPPPSLREASPYSTFLNSACTINTPAKLGGSICGQSPVILDALGCA